MDLFSQLPESETITPDEARNSTLVKRLRVLLHAFPLFQLSQADNRRDESLRHYDTLVIALKILDVIAERMGMEVEADREYIDYTLEPLLDGMDVQAGLLPNKGRHIVIVDRILAFLRNDADSRRPFKQTYHDVQADGSIVERQLEFRLIRDEFNLGAQGGETIMKLTDEAVNLYFNALGLDLEDSQAAMEAIVHSQLMRGKFDEARDNAHYALRQSRLYRDKLARMLRDTQRDISRVDWLEAAPRLISDAMKHLETRLDVESNIIQVTQARLDALTPGTRESAAVARVAAYIQQCVDTHTRLQRDLIVARTTFLDSQAQQAFVPALLSSKPNLMREVVEPLLCMNVRDAQQVIDRTMPYLVTPQPPSMLSLNNLFFGLLRPKRAQRKDWIDIDDIEPDRLDSDLERYSSYDREIAESYLQSIQRPDTLSSILARARKQHFSASQCEVIVLLVMQHFDLNSTETPIVRVEKTGAILDDEIFYGDEVMVSPYIRPETQKTLF